jgi:hypothetical protein
MRDVTAAPPVMTEAPPWENEKRVKAWAIATLEREEKAEIEAGNLEAAQSEPYKPEWPEGSSWAKYKKAVFQSAKRGDINGLLGFVDHFPLSNLTMEQRRIMHDVMVAGKIKRRRVTYKSVLHAGAELKFTATVMHVSRIRAVLVRAYGHKKGVLERAAAIAGVKGEKLNKVLDHFQRRGGN